MYFIQLEHSTGFIRCFDGTAELGSIKKDRLNIQTSEDLIEFVKNVGGVYQAIVECNNLNIY